MNIIEAIRERRSVRNYNGQPLSRAVTVEIEKAIAETTDPFGGAITVRLGEFDLSDGFRPGTYGVIKGATTYFMIAAADTAATDLSIGFVFEQIVLRAWQLGLGTCWIGGTFRNTDFNRLSGSWPEGQKLRIVSPVGIADRLTVREKIMRAAVGGDRRKPFEKLFFEGDFSTPLPADNRYGQSLEMLRLAPSSTNSQPWRALVSDAAVHFYYTPKSRLSLIDCGIGLCHFYETERFYSHEGCFFTADNPPVATTSLKYLLSYHRQ